MFRAGFYFVQPPFGQRSDKHLTQAYPERVGQAQKAKSWCFTPKAQHLNLMKNIGFLPMTTDLSNTLAQYSLDLQIANEREVDGVEMGVLNNGDAFLTLRGLARMCGVDPSTIVRITEGWQGDPLRPRERKIRELVKAQGADDAIAFYAVVKDGVVHHVFPDAVCMAVLEYYAFETASPNDHAAKSYRRLARKGFVEFIYELVGYKAEETSIAAWRQFHDRVSLSYQTVPAGYFSIFKELADLMVTLIRNGADLGPHFVPDISVGIAWSKYWVNESLEVLYGERLRYEHNYPGYFPQAASNPQQPYCYPDDALGEFRKWVRESYLPQQFPNYLSGKVKQGQIPAPAATAAVEAFKAKAPLPKRH